MQAVHAIGGGMIIIRRHLKQRVDVLLTAERDFRPDAHAFHDLQTLGAGFLFVVVIRRIIENLLQAEQMISAGNGGHNHTVVREDSAEFGRVKGREKMKGCLNRAVADGDRRDIRDEKPRAAVALCRETHHVLAQVKAVEVPLQPFGAVGGIVALTAADIEHAPAVVGIVLDAVADRLCQGLIIPLVQKIPAGFRHIFIVARIVAALAGGEQVDIAFLCHIEAVVVLTAQDFFV